MVAKRHATITVATEVIDHDHGHWCNCCLLSTGVRALLAVTTGPRAVLHDVAFCTECTSRDITPDPNPRRCGE